MLTGPEIKPRSGNPPKRLVILFHGIGVNGQNLIDIAGVLNRFIPDTHFIAPNAPFPYDMDRGNEYQWFSRQDRSEQAIMEGLQQVEPIVNEFIDSQLQRFNLREEDVAVLGFSQGTMVALHCFLRRPKPVALIAGFSGALIAPNLLETELKSKPPVLLSHGEDDNILPIGLMHQAEEVLRSHNVEVEARSYRDLAHAIGQEGFERAIDRFKEAFTV
jgi:phospholipase/carboxylesterase